MSSVRLFESEHSEPTKFMHISTKQTLMRMLENAIVYNERCPPNLYTGKQNHLFEG